MYDKFFVGGDLTSAENNGKQPPISRVTLLLDDENSLTAGDDTGIELVASCPHATQAMVDAILAQVKGHQYQMYSAENANIDPSAELGDGVTVDGIYSVISRIDDDGSGYAGLSAPGEAELEDEYPSGGPMMREFNRKISETRSRITKTAEQIRLEVFNEIEGLSASINVQLDSITQEVRGNSDSITATLDLINGFTITDSSGTTRIRGSSIETESIAASSISADKLNLTGAITFSDLDASTKTSINGAISTANSAYDIASSASSVATLAQSTVSGWQYYGTTYIDGSKLMTGTVKASSIQGGSVSLLDYYGSTSGVITITPATTGAYALDLTSYAALRINAGGGNLFLQSGSVGLNLSSAGINTVGADFFSIDRTYSLGTSYAPWAAVYASTGNIITSDRDQKHDIEYGLERYDELFDLLRPASYLLNNGVSGRRHSGMIAQDVEAAMKECGLTGMDFAGFVKAPRKNDEGQTVEGGYDYSLRYEEFIPICIEQIQRLKKRVSELEGGLMK